MMLREQLHQPARKLRPSALFANSRELVEVGLVEGLEAGKCQTC